MAKVADTGGKTRHGALTKEGSPWLRTVMVEAAQVAVRSSPTLKEYRDRMAFKHGRVHLLGTVDNSKEGVPSSGTGRAGAAPRRVRPVQTGQQRQA